jgi:hypothetical protein
LNTFETCPRQFFHKYITKDMGPEGEPHPNLELGRRMHLIFEECINTRTLVGALPSEHAYIMSVLISLDGKAEVKLAVDAHMNPVDYNDPNAIFRGILDYIAIDHDTGVGVIIDYKFGARTPSDAQIMSQTALARAAFPDVSTWAPSYYMAQKRKVHRAGDVSGISSADVTLMSMLELKPAIMALRHKIERDADDVSRWSTEQSGLCRGYCLALECPFNQPKPKR